MASYDWPHLKGHVDPALFNAFQDGHWTTVVRLADRRLKTRRDSYMEAVKCCGESQSENPIEKCAPAVAVDALVRGGSIPTDVETLDLYEWACREAGSMTVYSESLGVLRMRWARANPNSPAALSCFQACLREWDLVNAQKIAAALDKLSSTVDRRYMFWSITLTYMLSTSIQCPPEKENIYGMLALKQLERAANLAESTADPDGIPRGSSAAERDLRSDQEFELFFKILARLGAPDDFAKHASSAHIGAIRRLQEGKKHLFLEVLDVFESRQQWDTIYDYCIQAFQSVDPDGAPSLSISDWGVWKRFISAAGKQPDAEAATAAVRDALQRFLPPKSNVAQMHAKNIGLALVHLTFHSAATICDSEEGGDVTPRVAQLCLFLEQHWDKISIFQDVRPYVELLRSRETRHFIHGMFPRLIGTDSGLPRRLCLETLQFKLRYFATTCPQALTRPLNQPVAGRGHLCKTCGSTVSRICPRCLEDLVGDVGRAFQAIAGDEVVLAALAGSAGDPRPDLALTTSMALLKLSGLDAPCRPRRGSPLHFVDVSRFLQAVLLLDCQLQKSPGEVPLLLLLVKLYLLLGCGTAAHSLWTPMDVKRTIQDALAPLFFDRISSVAPTLFQPGTGAPLMTPLKAYYRTSLREPAPVTIWDAFSAGNYTSILDMAEFDDRLRRSCTRVMAAVEERRGTRSFGAKVDDIEEVSLFASVAPATRLVDVTDFGSLPNYESSGKPALAELVQFGPGLSHERSHLALLSERYLELVAFQPAKDYRPAQAGGAASAERFFVVETLSSLGAALVDLLHRPETAPGLTAPEESYYTILSLLSSIVAIGLNAKSADPRPPALAPLLSSLRTALTSLRTAFLSESPSALDGVSVLYRMADQHTASTLRDAGLAIKHSAVYVLGFGAREAARDRTGRANVHREVLAEMRALETLGTTTLGEIKSHVKKLQGSLGEAGWLDRVVEWTVGSGGDGTSDATTEMVLDMVGGRPAVEEWASRVLESWREAVRGWGRMKME